MAREVCEHNRLIDADCAACRGTPYRMSEVDENGHSEVSRARIAELEAALARIAFGGDISALAGNPMHWPCTVAYQALGGRFGGGVRIDDATLRARFNMQQDR